MAARFRESRKCRAAKRACGVDATPNRKKGIDRIMKSDRRKSGFTLIEVLIVVVIMAVLAATIIPQFTSTTKDAQQKASDFNAATLRTQIQLYKIHHGDYPAMNELEAKLTDRTDPKGPYLDVFPANPTNNKKTLAAVTEAGKVPTAPTGADTGWQYDVTTGGIWPNHTGWTLTP